MGGLEGFRGYYYQALSTFLNGVMGEEWIQVILEANSKEDKIDILWEYSEKVISIQVKSSINNFSKSDISKWLYELIDDTNKEFEDIYDEIFYELILIGPINADTTKFCNKINDNTIKEDDVKDSKLKMLFSKLTFVNIKLYNLELQSLKSNCMVSMLKYLENNYSNPGLDTLEQISNSIINELIENSLERKAFTHRRLNAKIKKILDHYSVIPIENLIAKPKLNVTFYEKGLIEDTQIAGKMHLDSNIIIEPLTNEVKDLINEALLIRLEKAQVSNDGKEELKLNSLKGFQWIFEDKPAQFSTEDQLLLETFMVENKIDFNKDDLNLGNLLIKKDMFNKDILNGKENEKLKYDLLNTAISMLYLKKFLEGYVNKFKNVYKLPMVITNEGNKSDENIRILFEFPTDVQVLNSNTIPVPYEFLIDDIIDNARLSDFLKSKKDAKVESFSSTGYYYFYKPSLNFNLPGTYNQKYSEVDFVKYCDSLLEFRYSVSDGKTYIDYELKNLRAGAKTVFPTYLLIKTELPEVIINYHITSKNSENISGVLIWKNSIASSED